MYGSRAVAPAVAGAMVVLLAGCSVATAETSAAGPRARTEAGTGGTGAGVAASPRPGPHSSPTPSPTPTREATRVINATLSIPSIDLTALRVVPYKGTTDDWPGTRIQNRGIAASPYGPDGGVGPGQVGNYLITAHRLSAGGPLQRLPDLKVGGKVLVTAGGTVYEYKITETRKPSFRSERSLQEQRAAVPGDPGKRPTQAMITVSTCATPEDNAAGNFWRDDRDNPEHRIDKVGVLVSTHKAPTGSPSPTTP